MTKKIVNFALIGLLVLLVGCAPEVGSKAWCNDLEEKPKGDWSANEATDYAKHCIFKSRDEE